MPCFVPFDERKLDVCFFVFRPAGGFADELIDALKYFSFHAEDIGCLYSSIFKSIHGNLIIWYGAWIRRSSENRKTLTAILLSALDKVSSMAILLQHGFFDAFFGESKDGSSIGKFFSGDIVSLSGVVSRSDDASDLSYACLALQRSLFTRMDGVSAGICLRCQDKPVVASLFVWKSLHDCYSWLLNSDYRRTILPYFSHLSDDTQFDVFKVVYVSRDDVLSIQPYQYGTIANDVKEYVEEKLERSILT